MAKPVLFRITRSQLEALPNLMANAVSDLSEWGAVHPEQPDHPDVVRARRYIGVAEQIAVRANKLLGRQEDSRKGQS